MKKYIITSAQEEAPINSSFFNNLKTYALSLGAEVLVIPYARGKYFGKKGLDVTVLDTGATIVKKDLKLGEYLQARVMAIGGQQINPLTGIDRFVASNKSAIVGSPKQFLRCVAMVNKHNLPKVLLSTGTITQPQYRNSAQGVKAEIDHVYGFIYVEVLDNGMFNYRPVRADKNGHFQDMTYTSKPSIKGVEAMVLGDLHAYSIDPTVWDKTLTLIDELKPKNIFIHDIWDGASVNHHEEHNYIKQVGKPTIQEEAKLTADILQQLRDITKAKIHIVKSNHDEWLDDYLDKGKYHKDSQNLKLAANLLVDKVEGKDPVKTLIQRNLRTSKGIVWLNRLNTLKIKGFECGQHGDKGPNGSKGNHKSGPKIWGAAMLGHEHTPAILNDVYVVGTSTYLRLPYSSSGPSSWMNTHGIIYSNGKASLINVL